MPMRTRTICHALCLLLFLSLLTACQSNPYKALNAQAKREYRIPIRPCSEEGNPCWNVFAKKFIYAPAFSFPEAEGASGYRFTLTPDTGDPVSFRSAGPAASLAAGWDKIPCGNVKLTVDAVGRDGEVLGQIAERKFVKDFPFEGPYPGPASDYRDAALKCLLYIHTLPEIQNWTKGPLPDMQYRHNTYPCKIIGATIRVECLVASLMPARKENALAIARNAAQFLIDQSRSPEEPLAYFPPTYYSDLLASGKSWNQGKTMTLEAVNAGHAFLDLHDLTGEGAWLDRAVEIGRTYVRLQRPDGSLPIKVDFATGEPVNGVSAMLQPLLRYFVRLEGYGFDEFAPAREKGERWMDEVAMKTFDMTGQFEDVNVNGLKPYQNLTNCTAAPYASYLLTKPSPDAKDRTNALDLIRMSEDQFVHWAYPERTEDGIWKRYAPCVHEQYSYEMPVDASACNMANAWLDWYSLTGDLLSLAKAKALIDQTTRMQSPESGKIATCWEWRDAAADRRRSFWANCSLRSVMLLLRADAMKDDLKKLESSSD